MSLLVVRDLHAGYGKSEVLHGVGLTVPEGEIVTLIGANGAGKTTLLRTISGLLLPAAGRMELAGVSLARRPAHDIVAMGISQVAEGRMILRRMTVLENLKMGAFVRRDSGIGADIEAMFARFPALGPRRHQLAGTLSGGEQQMLAIGRALMARPRLLLMDEPSLGLAPRIVTQIFRAVRDLKHEGQTILLVEQKARQALQIADRGYVLERGRVVMEGTGESLLGDPEVQHTYLGRRAS